MKYPLGMCLFCFLHVCLHLELHAIRLQLWVSCMSVFLHLELHAKFAIRLPLGCFNAVCLLATLSIAVVCKMQLCILLMNSDSGHCAFVENESSAWFWQAHAALFQDCRHDGLPIYIATGPRRQCPIQCSWSKRQ